MGFDPSGFLNGAVQATGQAAVGQAEGQVQRAAVAHAIAQQNTQNQLKAMEIMAQEHEANSRIQATGWHPHSEAEAVDTVGQEAKAKADAAVSRMSQAAAESRQAHQAMTQQIHDQLVARRPKTSPPLAPYSPEDQGYWETADKVARQKLAETNPIDPMAAMAAMLPGLMNSGTTATAPTPEPAPGPAIPP